MSIELKFKDNSDIVLKALYRAMREASNEMAVIARDAVQYQMLYGYKDRHGRDGHTEIVETGRLFDSIKANVNVASQNTYGVTVGTDVPYAKCVHDGTRKLKARRFIRDGLLKANKKLESAAINAFKNA